METVTWYHSTDKVFFSDYQINSLKNEQLATNEWCRLWNNHDTLLNIKIKSQTITLQDDSFTNLPSNLQNFRKEFLSGSRFIFC